MNRVIRTTRTGHFLRKDASWTTDLSQAATFGSYDEAQATVHTFHLQDVELYYCFRDTQASSYDFAVSLSSAPSERPNPPSARGSANP